jgi:hypothetical protein
VRKAPSWRRARLSLGLRPRVPGRRLRGQWIGAGGFVRRRCSGADLFDGAAICRPGQGVAVCAAEPHLAGNARRPSPVAVGRAVQATRNRVGVQHPDAEDLVADRLAGAGGTPPPHAARGPPGPRVVARAPRRRVRKGPPGNGPVGAGTADRHPAGRGQAAGVNHTGTVAPTVDCIHLRPHPARALLDGERPCLIRCAAAVTSAWEPLRRMPAGGRSTAARRARSQARRGGSPPARRSPAAALSGRRRRPSHAAAGERW